MQDALRTGRVPDPGELARVLSKERDRPEADVLAQINEVLAGEEETDEPLDPPHPDEEIFRNRYRKLVDAMIAAWHEENPSAGNIPTEQRERIEDHCNRQIQHAWRLHQQRLAMEHETDL
ncbi:hypothetical protein BKN37_07025 [Mycobacterium talmoniae]|uniref:Uncharacterized protein n=1 Tax=Mycobacterium talmoniae TaxID=1858794 RepID=A0A1S1NH66_9MYCO|nr:hypothetical protein BKN37_07025 [Mycobacterium talmoniae]